MKKITKEKKSVVQWLISNKIRICVGICVLYLGIIGVVTLFYIDSGNLLEILYYVSQILSVFSGAQEPRPTEPTCGSY